MTFDIWRPSALLLPYETENSCFTIDSECNLSFYCYVNISCYCRTILGVIIEMTPSQVARSVEECGVGFMYAPMNHPAMKTVAPVRKALGVRTAFNLLGPMTNAASAQHVVIGVFEESLVELMARTLMGTSGREKIGN